MEVTTCEAESEHDEGQLVGLQRDLLLLLQQRGRGIQSSSAAEFD
jgi:hypothetical protein